MAQARVLSLASRRAVRYIALLTGGAHPKSPVLRARSSAGEHYVDIVGVTGSIPVAPTIPAVFNASPAAADDLWVHPIRLAVNPGSDRGRASRW